MTHRVSHPRLPLVTLLAMVALGAPAAAGDRGSSAVTAWGRLELFERATNGKLVHRTRDLTEKSWSAREAVADATLTSAPSALMTDDGTRLAVFFRGADGKLYHVFRDRDTEWSPVIGLGTRELSCGPTAVIAGKELTVFARDADGVLMEIHYDRNRQSWTDWANVD